VSGTSSNRVKILHYHLFKNAGTSVDAILQSNFPGAWQDREITGNENPQVSDCMCGVSSRLNQLFNDMSESSFHYISDSRNRVCLHRLMQGLADRICPSS